MATRPLPIRPSAARPPSRALAWLIALALLGRALLLAAPIAIAFLIVTALLAGVIEEDRFRLAVGALACLGLPLLLRWRLGALLEKRPRLRPPPTVWFVAAWNLAAACLIGIGFSDDVGRAVRRHGDWFLGEEQNGPVARGLRGALVASAGWLERQTQPPELAPVILPPDLHELPAGPWRPGEQPADPPSRTIGWFHPLAGPRRALPFSEGRRFGAARPQPRPTECELGHCGVDLGSTLGEPVFAIFDGVVEKIERDEARGGNAGRYVRIGHKAGTVVSRYIHLDTIRDDLREGDRVSGGQVIGRLGRSGVFHSGPHLHFGLSLRAHGRGDDERYIDPEPLLRVWALVDASKLPGALAAR